MEDSSLPFTTRKMLNFEQATKFQITVISTASVTGSLYLTGATKDGIFTYRINTTSNGHTLTFTVGISDIPIWISVIDSDQIYQSRQAHISVFLTLNNNQVHQLCMGYVGQFEAISWPQTHYESANIVRGDLQAITISNPSAGGEISYAKGLVERAIVRGLTFQLACNGTVANRIVTVNFQTLGITFNRSISVVTQVANETKIYTLQKQPNGGATSGNGKIIVPLPEDIIYDEVDTISTLTEGIQTGDQFSNIKILLEIFRNYSV